MCNERGWIRDISSLVYVTLPIMNHLTPLLFCDLTNHEALASLLFCCLTNYEVHSLTPVLWSCQLSN
jgi:hypothetical protein